MSIYLSGFKPRGVRKEWDRTSISREDALGVLKRYLPLRTPELPASALAYWDVQGFLRVMACDMTDGRRVVLRTPKSGDWSVEILPSEMAA